VIEFSATPRICLQLGRSYEWLLSRKLVSCAIVTFLALGLRAALVPWLAQSQPKLTHIRAK
jgi:hypothetical protein